MKRHPKSNAAMTAAHVGGHNVAVEQIADAQRQATRSLSTVMRQRVSLARVHQTNVVDGDAAIQNTRHTRPVTTVNATRHHWQPHHQHPHHNHHWHAHTYVEESRPSRKDDNVLLSLQPLVYLSKYSHV